MSMTQDLHDALMLDLPLRPAMVCDFGLIANGSGQHAALQRAVRAGATEDELVDVCGDGEKIAKLVKKYTELEIDFTTVYDAMTKSLWAQTKTKIKDIEAKKIISEGERQDLQKLYTLLNQC